MSRATRSTPRRGKGPGRPSKCYPAVRQRILDLVRTGVGTTRAARLAGIDPKTVFRWADKLPDFAASLEAAREAGLGEVEAFVGREARLDSATARWVLERKLPEEWGRPTTKVQAAASFDIESLLALVEARRREQPKADTPTLPPAPARDPAPRETPAPAVTLTLEAILGSAERPDGEA